jgi:hypothetical protein
LNLDAPKALKMEQLDWIIITEENYKQVFDDLKKKNKDVVLFGLTDDGYETSCSELCSSPKVYNLE